MPDLIQLQLERAPSDGSILAHAELHVQTALGHSTPGCGPLGQAAAGRWGRAKKWLYISYPSPLAKSASAPPSKLA